MKERKKIIIGLVVLVLIIPLGILAKYLYSSLYEHYLTTKDFYFYSDYLDTSTPIYKLDNWSGMDNYNISFNLLNYQNELKYTANDIKYDISYECSNNVTCSTDIVDNKGTILGGSKNYNNINLIITPKERLNAADEVTILVKASTNNIFKKELSAKYVISISDIDYNIVDGVGSMYATLNLANNSNHEKEVTLTFDNSVVNIDTSNKLVLKGSSYNKDEYLKSVTIKLGALTDNSINFYKNDVEQDYSYPSSNKSIISISY